jgi:Membrane bound O-acyl transferase family
MAGLLESTLSLLLAFAAGTGLNIIAAQLPKQRRARNTAARIAAAVLTALALTLPFALHGPPFFRAILGVLLGVETWRVLEVLRTPDRFSRRERALRVALVPYEYTFLERVPRRWPISELLSSSVLLAAGVAILVASSRLSPPLPPYALAGWPRWLGATVGVYLAMEGASQQWVAVLPAFGFRHRPYQRHPILSRTIAEFWGVRWSSVVHVWLRSNVYAPLARRGVPRAGIIAAFAVSALLHAYLVWPAAGLVPALWMLMFFLTQGTFMVLEAKLRVRRWPAAAGHSYVAGVFAVTIPLFAEPFLRAVGL